MLWQCDTISQKFDVKLKDIQKWQNQKCEVIFFSFSGMKQAQWWPF